MLPIILSNVRILVRALVDVTLEMERSGRRGEKEEEDWVFCTTSRS